MRKSLSYLEGERCIFDKGNVSQDEVGDWRCNLETRQKDVETLEGWGGTHEHDDNEGGSRSLADRQTNVEVDHQVRCHVLKEQALHLSLKTQRCGEVVKITEYEEGNDLRER